VAYSLGCEDHVINLPYIEKYIEKKIESEWIEVADMVEDKAGSYSRSRIKEERTEERGRTPENRDHSRHHHKEKSHVAHNRGNEERQAGKKREDLGQKRDFEKKPEAEKKADFEKRQAVKKSPDNGDTKKFPVKKTPPKSLEERLAYYKDKYGEDFTLAKGGKKNGGLLKKLFGIGK